MNIIEIVRGIVQTAPQISKVCSSVHIDFSNFTGEDFGLSPTGDYLVSEDVLGNQKRRHTFILYAVYQSINDYDRLANSGALLELQQWLEAQAQGQEFEGEKGTIVLSKLTCSNGMLIEIPQNNFNTLVRYQLQITAEYEVNF